jgi:hypothetical protein
MSEVTFAASFRFANDMEFSLLRTLAVADPKLAGGVPDVPARLDGRDARPSIAQQLMGATLCLS